MSYSFPGKHTDLFGISYAAPLGISHPPEPLFAAGMSLCLLDRADYLSIKLYLHMSTYTYLQSNTCTFELILN